MQNDCVGKYVDEKSVDVRSVEENCTTGTIDLCDSGTV